MISFKVFMQFIDEDADTKRVFSKECFDTWVVTRKEPPKQPEESFRRVLTAHICGVDGRRPFPPKIEASLLQILRKKEVWECFRGTKVSIGIRGFRNFGYHETKAMKLAQTGPGLQDDLTRKRKRRGVEEDTIAKVAARASLAPYLAGACLSPLQSLAQAQLHLQAQQLQQLGQTLPGGPASLMQYTQQRALAGIGMQPMTLPQTAYAKHMLPPYVAPMPQLQQSYGLQTPMNSPVFLVRQPPSSGSA